MSDRPDEMRVLDTAERWLVWENTELSGEVDRNFGQANTVGLLERAEGPMVEVMGREVWD